MLGVSAEVESNAGKEIKTFDLKARAKNSCIYFTFESKGQKIVAKRKQESCRDCVKTYLKAKVKNKVIFPI